MNVLTCQAGEAINILLDHRVETANWLHISDLHDLLTAAVSQPNKEGEAAQLAVCCPCSAWLFFLCLQCIKAIFGSVQLSKANGLVQLE